MLLASIAILFVPGLIVGFALGGRRLLLTVIAPPLTISVIAVASVVNHVVGFRWGVLPVLVTAVILAGIVWGLQRLWRKRWPAPRLESVSQWAWIFGGSGLVFGFVALTARFTAMFGAPNHVSQTFDNIFHINAVNYIIEMGNASPLKVGSLTYAYDGAQVFYPDMWHAFIALVAELTGASVPVSINVGSIAIAAVMWPLACLFLVRVVVGVRPIALLAAGVLSAAFSGFPYLMVDFGVLYPNLLSISILPVALALVILICGFGSADLLSPPARWLALVAVLPGLALAHPSTLMALIAFSVPIVLSALIRRFVGMRERGAPPRSYITTVGLALIGFGIAAIILIVARPDRAAAFWGPREPVETAVLAAVNSSFVGRPGDWVIASLVVFGIWSLRRARKQQWLIGTYIVAAGLYVIAASFQAGTYRYWVTGIWYNDSFRLAALLPVIALPLAVVGVLWVGDLCMSGVDAMRSRRGTGARSRLSVRRTQVGSIAGFALVGVIAVSTQTGAALASATESGQERYAFTEESSLLSPDEMRLIDRIDDEVPADAAIMGSPWTGTSLVFALADRRALLPHIYGYRDPATTTLIESLRDAAIDPAVCDAVRELNALYVLDFGAQEVHGGKNILPGITDLKDSPAVKLIDEQGDAELYRVVACD